MKLVLFEAVRVSPVSSILSTVIRRNALSINATFWLLILLTSCGRNAQRFGSISGSIATCDNDGQEIFIPHISSDPCIRCICRNTIVECSRQTCRPLEGCHVILHEKPPHICCDLCKGCTYMGRQYPSGTEWSADGDPCQRYRCEAAVLTRYRVQCTITCKSPIIIARQCCPLCNGCKIGNIFMDENSTMTLPDDRCVVCSCNSGRLMCEKRACPVLNCLPSSQMIPSGECCPVCVDHRRIFDLTSFGKCFFRRQVYVHGASVFLDQDACTQCTCTNGTIACKRRVCPQLDCVLNASRTSTDMTSSDRDLTTCCRRCAEYKRNCRHGADKYRHGDTWKADACTHCYCYDGVIRCHVQQCSFNAIKCPKNFQIRISDGSCCPECVEVNGVCAVFGDPHYRTFDGRIFTFQGPCSYLLAASGNSWCGPLNAVASGAAHASSVPVFAVRVTNVVRGLSNMFAWTKSVSVSMDRHADGRLHTAKIDLYQKLRVHVNRTRVNLPYVDRASGFTVEERLFGAQNAIDSVGIDPDDAAGQRLGNGLRVVVLSTSIGLQVIWDGGSYLELSIPPQYKRRVCGLCGNYNGLVSDDFTGPDSQVHMDTDNFGNSWQLLSSSKLLAVDGSHRNEPTSCSRGLGESSEPTSAAAGGRRGVGADNEMKQTGCDRNRRLFSSVERYCRSILKGKSFKDCRQHVKIDPYYRSCLMDACDCAHFWKRCACQTFTAYGRACQRAGIRLLAPTLGEGEASSDALYRWPCGGDDRPTPSTPPSGRVRRPNGKKRKGGNEILRHLAKTTEDESLGNVAEDDDDDDTGGDDGNI